MDVLAKERTMASKKTSKKSKSNGAEKAAKPAETERKGPPLFPVEIWVENIKRIRAVRLHLKPGLNVIGGDNEQGKTSLLDSLEMLLLGAKAFPDQPVTKGKKKGLVGGDFGELTIERTIRANRSHTLEIKLADGAKVEGPPQAYLEKLVAKRMLDPLAFATDTSEKQDATLRQLTGLDFTELDARRGVAYQERTRVNAEAKQAKGHAESLPRHPDAPKEPISVAQLTEALEEAEKELADQAEARQALVTYDQETERLVQTAREIDKRIEDLEMKLAELRPRQTAIGDQILARRTERKDLAEAVDALVPPDTSQIRTQLRNADELNAQTRANQARAEALSKADKLRHQSEELTEQIEAIDEQKAEQIAAAKFPIEGLGFDPAGGVTFEGLPFEQASQSRRLRVSVAIAFALNPRIRLALAREGGRLDDKSLATLAQAVHDAGALLLLERVGKRDAGAIIIEDGSVKED
jgi:DNA repair ATPase RecN